MWSPPDAVEPHYFASGTESLAAVLSAIIQRSDVVGIPEVLVPGYTCPDVVSAIAFAGAKAVPVDLEPERPWMAPESLNTVGSDACVALVAINFQGIDERIEALRGWCDRHKMPLIYDHCQAFPPTEAAIASSDALVFSHGRGKPASALVGGAVWLSSKQSKAWDLPEPEFAAAAPSALKRALYNLVIRPSVYGWLTRVPGLGIGETVFHPLTDLRGLTEAGRRAVFAAVDAHIRMSGFETRRAFWERGLADQLDWVDLPQSCHADRRRPLLRYTVLAPSRETRDRMLARLQGAGLGATPLYPAVLPQIDGVAQHCTCRARLTNATDFAGRVLTLPIHSAVTHEDVKRTVRALLES
ncbi:MAG: DegT/DnrJ/EryC1/StrS family aminotransferase [Pseudomonadota bacterium]